MRALKILGLLVVAALAALLSGAPGGAGATTAAVAAVATDMLDSRFAAAAPAAPRTPAPEPGVAPQPAVTAATTAAAARPTTTTVATPTTTTPSTTAPRRPTAERAARGTAEGTPCRASARACVDLSANRAWLIDDGEVSYGPVPITHGRKGFRTPPGTFAVSFKNRDHVSSIYDAPMPYSVFFNGGIAFHEGSLNERSHGCIHLSRAAAKRFFAALGTGDTVQVVR